VIPFKESISQEDMEKISWYHHNRNKPIECASDGYQHDMNIVVLNKMKKKYTEEVVNKVLAYLDEQEALEEEEKRNRYKSKKH